MISRPEASVARSSQSVFREASTSTPFAPHASDPSARTG